MIEFRGVTKRFPDGTVAVDDLDLVAERGRITVFVGPSGCGKTTSLRMINRMVEPSAGRLEVDGRDVLSADPAELRRGIGYVIQQAGLFPHRTIVDNIATVPMLLGRGRRAARDRARELMETVGLDVSMAGRYPAQLSGGQQQRVGVARALAADPPVLLMDEPFSAVDPVVRESLQDELLRLQSELGKTIVFVTHDIDEAVKLGDRVAVFRVGGRLAQYDEPGVLLSRPVDDFVDTFVGRDRGYRGLGFLTSDTIPLGPLDMVSMGDPLPDDGWAVVLDGTGRPLGWVAAGDGPVTEDTVVPGGSLYPVGSGSLRGALDAALSSPSGQGVAVDAEGRVAGSVTADAVLAALPAARDDSAA
ncbi:osmoprotectant transport system ATP-binding protein [Pseudonocardia ammonioxydans]|uniref:ABC-type quaternary amine transporter n=1 Tax=Pseudonocardia ammonioxydans TaxID=260086 RepID=A0A1I4WI25_PSUAM|nr:ATP-binding cassette domain-containing protein [Pseudonocardia ammonioxydans]SFN13077.1 osmoprotectant transport system ATP-binding protein [Pseudonocardia ammonioxydans]